MKFSTLTLGLFASLALAAPTPCVKRDAEVVNRYAASGPIGYASENGGTTGGEGGTTTTVSTYAQFTAAVTGDDPAVVYVSAPITTACAQVRIGSNKSVIGTSSEVVFTGFGVLIISATNVIFQNIAIAKVLAEYGDALGVQLSTNVWIDHVDLSSDLDHDKDYYDGLLDMTHAADFVTISNSYLHDHWKASLVGHSDDNSAEDTGHLRITYHNNYFSNLNSRGPSFRFGTGHIFNNYYSNVADGINTRLGAQLLVENNVFVGGKKPLYSTDSGYAVATGNDFGGLENTAEVGTLTSMPYEYSLVDASAVQAAVVGTAGNTLSF